MATCLDGPTSLAGYIGDAVDGRLARWVESGGPGTGRDRGTSAPDQDARPSSSPSRTAFVAGYRPPAAYASAVLDAIEDYGDACCRHGIAIARDIMDEGRSADLTAARKRRGSLYTGLLNMLRARTPHDSPSGSPPRDSEPGGVRP